MGILGTLHAAISHRGKPGGCQRGRRAETVARTGLLQPGTQPPHGSPPDSGTGKVSRHAGRHQAAQGCGRLHGGCHRLHSLRLAGCRGRRQCLQGAGALLRHQHAHQHHTGEKGICSPGAVVAARKGGFGLQPGHDGLRRSAVHAAVAPLPALSPQDKWSYCP